MDAARLLPVLGIFLFLLPILWSQAGPGGPGRSTAADGLYLFFAWGLLIALAALLGPRLILIERGKRSAEQPTGTDDAGD